MTKYDTRERYKRNNLSLKEQEQLWQSHVLLIGLGGLGGHILDMLIRMGIGTITAIDGDTFEASNLNRQLLCHENNIGQKKAHAAIEYVQKVNSKVTFHAIDRMIHNEEFIELMSNKSIVVDALGGLDDREALHTSAAQAHLCVVSAAIAGLTGWISVIEPQEQSPAFFLGKGEGAEKNLGNFAPTVAFAASLQCSEILKILLQKNHLKGTLFFDLTTNTFLPTQWS